LGSGLKIPVDSYDRMSDPNSSVGGGLKIPVDSYDRMIDPQALKSMKTLKFFDVFFKCQMSKADPEPPEPLFITATP